MEVVYHNLGVQIRLVIKKLLVVVRAPIYRYRYRYMLHPKMDRRYEPCCMSHELGNEIKSYKWRHIIFLILPFLHDSQLSRESTKQWQRRRYTDDDIDDASFCFLTITIYDML